MQLDVRFQSIAARFHRNDVPFSGRSRNCQPPLPGRGVRDQPVALLFDREDDFEVGVLLNILGIVLNMLGLIGRPRF